LKPLPIFYLTDGSGIGQYLKSRKFDRRSIGPLAQRLGTSDNEASLTRIAPRTAISRR
jgi:hypothetical protein